MQNYKNIRKGSNVFAYLCCMRILLVDNYDSFTWNLFHYLELFADRVEVVRNDDKACLEVMTFDGIVVSPGPGLPGESGLMPEVIASAAGKVPVLGVCLGMQAIAEYYGGRLLNLPEVLHGRQCKTTLIDTDEVLFRNLPDVIKTGHYHSWVADPETLPEELKITAIDEFGNIMALSHKTHSMKGVQFHPESVLTPHGKTIVNNWIRMLRFNNVLYTS